jgi:hypothetical protein
MFRLPLIGFTACTQHIGLPRSTSKPFTVAAQPGRRVLFMFLRNIPSPYSLTAQRFQQARLLLRYSAVQNFYRMRSGTRCVTATIFQSSGQLAMPGRGLQHPDASVSKNA